MRTSVRKRVRHPVLLALGLAAVLALPVLYGCSDSGLPNYQPPDDDGPAPKDSSTVGMMTLPGDPGGLLA